MNDHGEAISIISNVLSLDPATINNASFRECCIQVIDSRRADEPYHSYLGKLKYLEPIRGFSTGAASLDTLYSQESTEEIWKVVDEVLVKCQIELLHVFSNGSIFDRVCNYRLCSKSRQGFVRWIRRMCQLSKMEENFSAFDKVSFEFETFCGASSPPTQELVYISFKYGRVVLDVKHRMQSGDNGTVQYHKWDILVV